MGRHKKYTEANTDQLAKGETATLKEFGESEGVESVTERDFMETAKLEAFMNQKLLIIVHPATEEGALDVIVPMVNGINQPIIRGAECLVKRKYVESLARTRTTRYEQKILDAARPENIQMAENTALTYPFAVLDDPDSGGREWLKNILAQP